MPKVTIEMDDLTLVMVRQDDGALWTATVSSSVAEQNGSKQLSDLQAAATAALAVGVEEPGLEMALYNATHEVWAGCPFSPIP